MLIDFEVGCRLYSFMDKYDESSGIVGQTTESVGPKDRKVFVAGDVFVFTHLALAPI